jgi:hypothetical protein
MDKEEKHNYTGEKRHDQRQKTADPQEKKTQIRKIL